MTATTAAISVRPAQVADLPGAVNVFLTACEDMLRRNNLDLANLPGREHVEKGYKHVQKTGIFYVAESAGEIVGVACAIVRSDVWFLSGFWVLPGHQNQGIGRKLLEKTWQGGVDVKAHTFFVWSSVDYTAMSTYMRFGMVPGFQNFTFGGQYKPQIDPPPGFVLEPLQVESAARIDEVVRGSERLEDHEFWMTESGHKGYQVTKDGVVRGYFYELKGMIGPAGWLADDDAVPLLTAACQLAASNAPSVRIYCPGINKQVINFAFANGLKLVSFSHIFLTDSVGDFTRYTPAGPLLY